MFLRALLFLTVALPALAVSVGRTDGEVVFVLYREPKLVAAVCLSWWLLATLAWTRPGVFRLQSLLATARRPAVATGLGLGAWLMVTRLWVRVPENWTYEAVQYATFGALFVVLVTLARDDGSKDACPNEAGVLATVRVALVTSLGFVAVLGILQWLGLPLPLELPPIRPEIGARHPSLMGWKNPAALAVVGQFFLLLGWAVRSTSTRLRVFLLALAALETVYVVSLGSRTAVLALAAGFVALLALGMAAYRRRGVEPKIPPATLRITVAATVLFALALGAVAAASPGLRQRLGSMASLTLSPSDYLASDRGVYLRNTLNMARHGPSGVGLGDWQTAYPVYRKHGRDVSFTASFEVRRAHSDHVQMLGEAGWPGLALWLVWLGLLAIGPARAFLRHPAGHDTDRLFVSVQVAALAVAMATDYVVELPYGKFQLFLVAALAVGRSEGEAPESAATASRSAHKIVAVGLALGLTVIALMACVSQIGHLQRTQTGAEITRRYEVALTEIRTTGRVERSRLEGILALGERFQSLPGGDKTAYRTYLVLSHSALLLERRDEARSAARRALELHPYSVDALAMMARVTPESCAESWRQAEQRVLEQATDGYVWAYPRCDLVPQR